MTTILTSELVKEIKGNIWQGLSHEKVAKMFYISQPHVSRIAKGTQWTNVPWPDGSVGPIPNYQLNALRKARFEKLQASNSEQLTSALDEVERVANAAAKEVAVLHNERFKAASSAKTQKVTKPHKKKVFEPKKLISWEAILERGQNVSLVVAMLDAENITLWKQALRIVFSQVSEQSWPSKNTESLVMAVYKKLMQDNEKNKNNQN